MYSKPPPRVAPDSSWHAHIHYPVLKDWGAAVDEEELFLISELEEFEDISVDSIWKKGYQPPRLPARDNAEDTHIERLAAAVENVKRRASTDLSKPLLETEEPPRKRRRLDDDSLYTALPQVSMMHFLYTTSHPFTLCSHTCCPRLLRCTHCRPLLLIPRASMRRGKLDPSRHTQLGL